MTISSSRRGSAIIRELEHVVDRDRDVVEDRSRIGVRADPLVGDDLGPGPLVPAVLLVVPLGVHREPAVLGDVARRDVELRLGRSPRVARRPEQEAVVERGRHRRRRSTVGRDRRHHDVADPQLDRGRRPPDHADRRGTPEIDPLGEVHRPTAVLGDRGRDEGPRLGDLGADQAVDLAGLDPGIGESLGRQVGPLGEPQPGLASLRSLRRPLGVPHDGGVTP